MRRSRFVLARASSGTYGAALDLVEGWFDGSSATQLTNSAARPCLRAQLGAASPARQPRERSTLVAVARSAAVLAAVMPSLSRKMPIKIPGLVLACALAATAPQGAQAFRLGALITRARAPKPLQKPDARKAWLDAAVVGPLPALQNPPWLDV